MLRPSRHKKTETEKQTKKQNGKKTEKQKIKKKQSSAFVILSASPRGNALGWGTGVSCTSPRPAASEKCAEAFQLKNARKPKQEFNAMTDRLQEAIDEATAARREMTVLKIAVGRLMAELAVLSPDPHGKLSEISAGVCGVIEKAATGCPEVTAAANGISEVAETYLPSLITRTGLEKAMNISDGVQAAMGARPGEWLSAAAMDARHAQARDSEDKPV